MGSQQSQQNQLELLKSRASLIRLIALYTAGFQCHYDAVQDFQKKRWCNREKEENTKNYFFKSNNNLMTNIVEKTTALNEARINLSLKFETAGSVHSSSNDQAYALVRDTLNCVKHVVTKHHKAAGKILCMHQHDGSFDINNGIDMCATFESLRKTIEELLSTGPENFEEIRADNVLIVEAKPVI
jgi:hypothetical protein